MGFLLNVVRDGRARSRRDPLAYSARAETTAATSLDRAGLSSQVERRALPYETQAEPSRPGLVAMIWEEGADPGSREVVDPSTARSTGARHEQSGNRHRGLPEADVGDTSITERTAVAVVASVGVAAETMGVDGFSQSVGLSDPGTATPPAFVSTRFTTAIPPAPGAVVSAPPFSFPEPTDTGAGSASPRGPDLESARPAGRAPSTAPGRGPALLAVDRHVESASETAGEEPPDSPAPQRESRAPQESAPGDRAVSGTPALRSEPRPAPHGEVVPGRRQAESPVAPAAAQPADRQAPSVPGGRSEGFALRTRGAVPSPSTEPRVYIGQVDVVVMAPPANPPARAPSAPTSPSSLASRRYLRNL